MNISAPFIARPVATTLLTIAIALAGVLGYSALPVSPLPQVDFPTISVTAQLPGASPDVVATSLADAARTPSRTDRRRHRDDVESQIGQARIMLQFGLDRDINGAAQDVQAAINAAQADLPTNLLSQADLPEGESGRRAGADPRADLEDADARSDVRRREQRAAAATVADFRRRAGDHQRRGAAGGARRTRSAARCPTASASRTSARRSRTPTPTRPRARSTSAPSAGRSIPTTRPITPPTIGTSSSPIATATPLRLKDVADVEDSVAGPEEPRAGRRQAGGAGDRLPPARREHHLDGRRGASARFRG